MPEVPGALNWPFQASQVVACPFYATFLEDVDDHFLISDLAALQIFGDALLVQIHIGGAIIARSILQEIAKRAGAPVKFAVGCACRGFSCSLSQGFS